MSHSAAFAQPEAPSAAMMDNSIKNALLSQLYCDASNRPSTGPTVARRMSDRQALAKFPVGSDRQPLAKR